EEYLWFSTGAVASCRKLHSPMHHLVWLEVHLKVWKNWLSPTGLSSFVPFWLYLSEGPLTVFPSARHQIDGGRANHRSAKYLSQPVSNIRGRVAPLALELIR